MASSGKSFSVTDSFAEQKKFVESLPSAKEGVLRQVVSDIQRKENPFDVEAVSIPKEVNVKLIQHAVTEQKRETEEKEKVEGKTTSAVVTRLLQVAGGVKSGEKITLHLPHADYLQSLTVNFDANGNVIVREKRKPLTAFQSGLVLEDGRKQKGFIVEAEDENNSNRVYGTCTR